MANTIITPSVMASSALATLTHRTILASLVNRDYEPDFSGKQGDTITVRKPATFVVDEFERASGIQLQDITEGSFTVTLDTIPDVSFPITAEELTLEVTDFENRFLNPAAQAIAEYLDGKVAELLVDTANGTGGGGVADGSTTPNAAWRTARAVLGRNKMPLANRYSVLSPEAVSDALGDDLVVTANQSGSTQALREADLGRLFGFDTFESGVFGHGPDDKGQADGVAFHREAVTLVTRTLQAPNGVAPNQVSVKSYGGFGLRVVQAYDVTKKQDVVSVDLLYGIAAGEDREGGVVELNFGQGS